MSAPNPPSIDEWQVQTARLTAFPLSSQLDLAQTWMEDVTGKAPSEFNKTLGETRTVGEIDECRLLLLINSKIIQWQVFPKLDPTMEGIPSLGQIGSCLNWFTNAMSRWFSNAPTVKRIGLGVSLYQPTSSESHAYEILNRYLRNVSIDVNCMDFHFQINRRIPSQSGIDGLLINRLTKWYAAQFELGIETPTGENIRAVKSDICCLDLDVNSVAEFKDTLPSEKLEKLFVEFGSLACEIAEHGDSVLCGAK